MQKLTAELGMKAMGNADEVGAAAVDYMRVAGHLVFAYFWARMAKVALSQQAGGDPFYAAKLATDALLLRQAAARDGRADPQLPRRRQALAGDAGGLVLMTALAALPSESNIPECPREPFPPSARSPCSARA